MPSWRTSGPFWIGPGGVSTCRPRCGGFRRQVPGNRVPGTGSLMPKYLIRSDAGDRTPSTEDRVRPLENASSGYRSRVLGQEHRGLARPTERQIVAVGGCTGPHTRGYRSKGSSLGRRPGRRGTGAHKSHTRGLGRARPASPPGERASGVTESTPVAIATRGSPRGPRITNGRCV
jgi:hypothetical protein